MTNNDLIGHNDSEQLRSIRAFIVPSWEECLLLVVLSLAIIMLFDLKVIWDVLTNHANLQPGDTVGVFQTQLDYFTALFQNELFGQLAVWLAWGLIGSVVYMGIWAAEHFYFQVREDVQGEEYVRGGSSLQQYWRSRASHYLFFFCASFVLLLAVVFFALVLLPFATGMVESVLRNGTLRSVPYAVVAIIVLAIGLGGLRRVWQIAGYAYRITFDPLPE